MLKSNKMNKLTYVRPIIILLVTMSLMGGASASTIIDVKEKYLKEGTPFQKSLKENISNGKYYDIDNKKFDIQILKENKTYLKIRATTSITFNSPKGAGHNDNKWPSLIVEKDGENIKAGNYDQKIKDSIESDIKKIKDKKEKAEKFKKWKDYKYESGQRTFEYVETYEISDLVISSESAALPSMTTINNFNYDILMGFTNRISFYRDIDASVIIWGRTYAYANVYGEYFATVGVRLPTKVNLLMPTSVKAGESIYPNTSIIGVNWNANKYNESLIDKKLVEKGNEFVAHLGASVGLRGWIYSPSYNFNFYLYNMDIDGGKNFTTPVGPYQSFPLPNIYLEPSLTGLKRNYWIGYIGLGISIYPDLSSKDITANWYSWGNSGYLGSGIVRYSLPNAYYNFGPIVTNINNNYADIILYDYRYYLSSCKITLGSNIEVYIKYWPLNSHPWDSPYVDLIPIDCSWFTGSYSIGPHPGTYRNYVYGNTIII